MSELCYMKMETVRCHICLEEEQKVNQCPLLKDLIQKHIGILVPLMDDLLSCERCITLLQLWDEFLDDSRLNLAITHPKSFLQYKQEAFKFDQKNFEQKLKPDPELSKFPAVNVPEVKSEEKYRNIKTVKEEISSDVPVCDQPVIDCSNLFAENNVLKVEVLPQFPTEGDHASANPDADDYSCSPTVDVGNTVQNLPVECEHVHHFRADGSVSPPYVPMQNDKANEDCVPTSDENSSDHSSQSDKQVLPLSVSSSKCVCLHCNREFLHPVLLDNHMKLSHFSTQSQIKQGNKKSQSCPRCCIEYATKNALFNHVFETHSEQKNGQFVCVFCEVLVSTRSDLKSHLRTHFGKTFHFKCKFCSKVMSSNPKLKSHILREHEDKDYCPSTVKKKSSLTENQFVCYICFKELSSKSCMRTHIRKFHQGENVTTAKNYTCNVCYNKFASNAGLSRHMIIHGKTSNSYQNNQSKISVNTNIQSDKKQPKLKLKIVKTAGSFACKSNEKSPVKTPVAKPSDLIIDSIEIPVDRETLSNVSKKLRLSSDPETENKSSYFLSSKNTLQTYCCFFCVKTFQSKLAIEYHINQSHLKEKHHLNICKSDQNTSLASSSSTLATKTQISIENNESNSTSKKIDSVLVDISTISKNVADKSLNQTGNITTIIEEKIIEVIDLD